MSLTRRSFAGFVGTFWLMFGGCGSVVLAAAFPQVGIGLLAVSLAFGLTVLTMAYAIGHISGWHRAVPRGAGRRMVFQVRQAVLETPMSLKPGTVTQRAAKT